MSPSPEISDTLRKQLDSLPTEPGVYIFTDTRTQTVYVGKATNLRSRVRSYFQAGADDGRFLFSRIVKHTASIDFIVCTNELEALLLENNLIKKHRPRYNLRLRDDKTYLSLRVTTAEAWPRVHPIRRWKDDGHLYFGPYSSSQMRSLYHRESRSGVAPMRFLTVASVPASNTRSAAVLHRAWVSMTRNPTQKWSKKCCYCSEEEIDHCSIYSRKR